MKNKDDDQRVKEIKRHNMWSFWLFVLLVLVCFVVHYFQVQNTPTEKHPPPTELGKTTPDTGK